MLSETEKVYNDGADNETTDSERFSPSPWSEFSERESHSSVEYLSHGSSPGPIEPIAVIGMSCRLAGSAVDPSSLWDMLVSGRTAWTPGPGRRFNMKAFQDPSGTKRGTTNACGGHFLREDIAAFDATFFGIPPVEATAMDPQHRLLLEVAYESFQNAGLGTDSIWGSNTGVYVGQWSSDYHEILTRDIEFPPLYLVLGTGLATASNRISYHFNLHGPSFTVDTGCSSSLVALHQAVQSLRNGETVQCFVGGVNLLLDPQRFSYQSQLKMFSNEGRSFSFDSRANGYGRGEGCTGVVLKPLSAALRDGNPVRAVIRNSVLNQDGRTQGISVPSATAQKEAILKAYRQANLDPHADYVEAHGTGTKVGDPIEVSAIAAALSQNRMSNYRLPIGSIKANIGHTESVAGLAGLIKAVLMLEHGIIPPQVNYEHGNPDILLDKWNLRIPVKLERQNLRRISVNSSGYGGTNAHVIVDAAGETLSSSLVRLSLTGRIYSSCLAETPRVFVISTASEKSCQRMCSRLAKYLVQRRDSPDPHTLLARLAYSLAKQSIHTHRVALVASNLDDLVAQLITTAHSAIPRWEKGQSRIALIFSGQGAQYAEMGRELLKSYPSFVHSLERARRQLDRMGCPWDLLSEICRPTIDSRVNEPAFSQPLCTAIQLVLVDMLTKFGLSPCAVLGHSSGEIAAAYASRAISFEDAMTVAYFRGLLASEVVVGNLQRPGAMLAVGAPPAMVDEHIQKIGYESGRMAIACFNSPSSVTVSGDSTAIDQLKYVLDKEGTFNRKLMTNGAAYHSHQMKLIERKYASALEALTSSPVGLSARMFSSVTGQEVDEHTPLDGEYWVRNLVNPVLFSQAFLNMCEREYNGHPIDTIVEVGPHSQLAGPVKQILKTIRGAQSQVAYTHTLERGKDAEMSLLRCLGFLHIRNGPVRLHDLNKDNQDGRPSLLVDLPPYPFDHERTFWHESRLSKDYRNRPFLPHELLGTLTADVNRLEPRWRRFLSLKESPWLRNHAVQRQVTFPAAAYITMAVQAILQHTYFTNPTTKVENILFRDISIGKALVLSDDEADLEITLSLRPQARTARESSSIWSEFRIFTVTLDQKWSEHCRGLLHAEVEPVGRTAVLTPEEFSRIDAQCTRETLPQKFYYRCRDVGLDLQHPFDCISSLRTSRVSAIATARAPDIDMTPGGVGDLLHPTFLDSCLFHGPCSIPILENGATSALVPTFVKQLRIANRPTIPSTELTCITVGGQDASTFDILVRDSATVNQEIVLEAQGVRLISLPEDIPLTQSTTEICHGVEWVTYIDAWTPKYRAQVCNSAISPESVTERNRSLDTLALYHVQRTLKEGTLADIPEGSGRYFFEWMQTVANDSYDASLLPENGASLDLGVIGEAIARLGPHLWSILTQKMDPLSLLTQDNLLSRIYTGDFCTRCYSQIAAYCRELGRLTPGLRVLEVGAGTASTTLPVLQAMNGGGSRYVRQYNFTDVSAGFFEAAKECLGDLADVVEFRVLDIERDTQEQGFAEARYDLIIAGNVVHATRCIDATLRNIRSLLKPGGKLVLMEVSRNTTYYNTTFGVFPGWWAGYEEGRRLSPLLTPPEWIHRLKLADFADPEQWFTDYSEVDGGTQSVFIASAPPRSMHEEPLPIHLIMTDSGPFTTPIVERGILQIQDRVPGLEISAHCLSMPSSGGNIAIFLPDVGKLLCNSPDPDCWQGFKDWILGARAVLLVSYGSVVDYPDTGLWAGLARSLRQEHSGIRLVTLDIHDTHVPVLNKLAELLPTLLRSPTFDLERPGSDVENEFAERDGQLFVPRVVHRPEISNYIYRSTQQAAPEMVSFLGNGRTLTAELGTPGLLESFRWKDDTDVPAVGPDDVRLELRAASINFKDVLIATGQLDGITEIRNDCSGVIIEAGANMEERFRPGDRVCALSSRSYTNYPVVHGDHCQLVPDEMSFAEAASLPIVWSTVYYSLVDRGRLMMGEKILIHSAAGAVGQAAIILAQHLGAEIFVTVGSNTKRDLLHDTYGIPPEHIFSSRTTAFHSGIKRLTSGYGVDVVLNSLSGEMFRESCNLVAPFGRFVEIGRKDLMDNALMPMEFLLRNITFAYVDLAAIIEQNKPLARRLLGDVVSLMAAGVIRPVTLRTIPISEIETAFRLIQARKHTGKVILTIEEDLKVKAIPPPPVQARLKPDATYAVVGGFGGLGRAIISWMADHGAKYILSVSRSGTKDQQTLSFIDGIRAAGINLLAKKCDVTSPDEVAGLAQEAERDGLPPIRGVIQSAMVLRDTLFEEMTVDDWQAALAPKIQGTKNLDASFRKDIDFFILLSSTIVLAGNVGQSNYAAGCSFQDALACRGAAIDAPVYSINIGPVADAGYVSENLEAASKLRRQGLGFIHTSELLALLNYAITSPQGRDPGQRTCAIGLLPRNNKMRLDKNPWMADRRFAHLEWHHPVGPAATGPAAGKSADVLNLLDGVTRFEDAVGIMCRAILQQLGKLIATPAATLNPAQSLDSYGVDSLVMVELRNWIGAYLQANVQLLVLRGASSIQKLAEIVTKESHLVSFDTA